jgi:GNAT superfamily N-acetyltransferase
MSRPLEESDASAAERRRPALYMLHSPALPNLDNPPPPGYCLRALASEFFDSARPVVEQDGTLTDAQWRDFRDRIVPDGLFLAECGGAIGTVSAVHNPAATRFYFPGGGEVGYLFVAPDHRERGVGAALVAAAVHRLCRGGYRHVFVGVQGWRLPAIRCYLRVGFRPFIHAPELTERWRSIFATLGREADEADWPCRLPEPTP